MNSQKKKYSDEVIATKETIIMPFLSKCWHQRN